jgi:hypothetical protein
VLNTGCCNTATVNDSVLLGYATFAMPPMPIIQTAENPESECLETPKI